MSARDIFANGLEKNPANHVPLSPLSFLSRAARVHPGRLAVIHGTERYSYGVLHERVCRFRAALKARGIGRGDVVAVLAPNTPVLLEAHYAVPAAGAVLNALNTRLDAASIAFILGHGEAKLLIVDHELAATAKAAIALLGRPLDVIFAADGVPGLEPPAGQIEYEAFLAEHPADHVWDLPEDEWSPIALNYTSGTTGDPKGVVYSHRGAFLSALANVISFGMGPGSVYLWVLPMFHCNGWTHSWAVTAAGGTHVCLRKVEPARIFEVIADEGVTHLAGAPVVLNMLIHAPASQQKRAATVPRIAVGGAPPPSIVIERMQDLGFEVVHLYGLTETYGPATICTPQDDWPGLEPAELARRMARQGCGLITTEAYRIGDLEDGGGLPEDGEAVGEILIRANGVMMGYLKNPGASGEVFKGGWLHTGDLAVMHPDARLEIRDRAKDVIISGGENISSVELEEVLSRHPGLREVAVVARPDPRWGESPCAFVERSDGSTLQAEELIAWAKEHMAGFKLPRTVIFGPLPKTSTGKVQKFALRERARSLPPTG